MKTYKTMFNSILFALYNIYECVCMLIYFVCVGVLELNIYLYVYNIVTDV